MRKPPAFQFYVRDWLSDPQLRMASHSSKGIWIDLLAYMWEAPERGKLEGTIDQIKKMVGATDADFEVFLDEAKKLKFADVTFSNNEVTLTNRRMWREQKQRENTRLRVQRHRSNARCNANVTLPSSSSTSVLSTPLTYVRGEGHALPSQEEISESSKKKISEDLERICEQLYQEKIFPEVHAFRNKMLKHHRNPRAVLHSLCRCYVARPEDPWAYCAKIMGVEDGNYNERDYRKDKT